MRREIKRIGAVLFMAVVAFTPVAANAAFVLNDNFNSYSDGNLSGQGGWTATAAAATPMQVAGGADKYVQLGTSGQDEYKAFSSVVAHNDGDSLATSLTLNVSAAQATGDYFSHLSDPAGTTTNFYQRLFAKSSGAGYVLGMLAASTGTPGYGTTVLNFNQEYDIDVVWSFVTGLKNDTFDIKVDGGAYLAYVWDAASAAEPANIGAANLRQGNAANAATAQVDDYTVDSIVPEPASLGLLAMGALFAARRRK